MHHAKVHQICSAFLCAMRIHLLDDGMEFPPVTDAGEEGLLAIGGDLSPARLLAAYEHGVFPWFMEEDPIMWWSPPVRAMLPLDALRVSKSMRNVLNQKRFRVTMDQDFEGVIRGCQRAPRDGEGTWISDEVVEAYLKLHELGSAHSVEVWQGDALAGGLYGVPSDACSLAKACSRLPPTPPKWR